MWTRIPHTASRIVWEHHWYFKYNNHTKRIYTGSNQKVCASSVLLSSKAQKLIKKRHSGYFRHFLIIKNEFLIRFCARLIYTLQTLEKCTIYKNLTIFRLKHVNATKKMFQNCSKTSFESAILSDKPRLNSVNWTPCINTARYSLHVLCPISFK